MPLERRATQAPEKNVSHVVAFDTRGVTLHARAVSITLPIVLLCYAGFALIRGWWPSAIAAPVVAWLLWRRHPRARFTTYVFFSVMTARGLLGSHWWLTLFALGAIGVLQLPAARRAWPRLTRGRPLR